MKRLKYRPIFLSVGNLVFLKRICKLIFLGGVLLLVSGCQKEEDEWNNAVKIGTNEAYVAFLENFPEGEFSVEAISLLRDYFEELHKNAFDEIHNDNDEKAKEIYEVILRIDPKNALALNNLAYILCTGFYDDRPKDQEIFSDRDKKYLEEVIELLEQSARYANRRRISSHVLAMVLEGRMIQAAQPPKAGTLSSSLRGQAGSNLEKLLDLLEMPINKPPNLEDLLIKGTYVDEKDNPLGEQNLWLLEAGLVKENFDSSEDIVARFNITKILDKYGMILNPSTRTDENGNFTFKVDGDNRDLDFFNNITLIIVATDDVYKLEENSYILNKNDRPFVFTADLDKSEMVLGKLN